MSRCPRCRAPLEAHTPALPRCTVCTRYDIIVGNAARVRRGGRVTGMRMTRTAFARWFTRQPRVCAYCGIDETDLPHLGLLTQMGHPLQRLGVDRLHADRGYTTANITLCCFACNKVKSNTFTADEMRILGAHIADLWRARLGR